MKKTLVIILGALMVIMSGFNSADATAILTLDDGVGNSATIIDNGTGDFSSTVGQVLYVGNVGVFSSTISTGNTKPIVGTTANPRLDLNSIDVSGGAGTLTISFEEDGFSGLYNPGGFLTEIGGATQGIVTVSSWIKEFGTTVWTMIDSLGDFSGGAFHDGTQSAWDPGEPYALKIIATITHGMGAGLSSSFNANLAAVPEPGTLMLLGSGLVGFYYVRRKNIFTK